MMTSLRSKWAAGKARGGRISKLIRNRGATQPPAHFHRNPLGRAQLAVFPRCSLLTYRFRYARRSRLEKQPTKRRRKTCLFRGQDTTIALSRPGKKILLFCDCFLSTPKNVRTGNLISDQASTIARQARPRGKKTPRIGFQRGSTTEIRCDTPLHKREI